jgi:hypothetical protein
MSSQQQLTTSTGCAKNTNNNRNQIPVYRSNRFDSCERQHERKRSFSKIQPKIIFFDTTNKIHRVRKGINNHCERSKAEHKYNDRRTKPNTKALNIITTRTTTHYTHLVLEAPPEAIWAYFGLQARAVIAPASLPTPCPPSSVVIALPLWRS